VEGAVPEFTFHVPEDLQAGRYANIVSVWHTGHEFTLDFSVTMRVEPPSNPGDPLTVPCEVVARVKIAPSLVFEVMQALNQNMTNYEQSFGDIKRPEPPEQAPEPPEEAPE
jgi:hypothetical protein